MSRVGADGGVVRVDLPDGGAEVGLAGLVGDDDERHRRAFLLVLPLLHGGDGDAVARPGWRRCAPAPPARPSPRSAGSSRSGSPRGAAAGRASSPAAAGTRPGLPERRLRERSMMSATTALPVGMAPAPWPKSSVGPSASDRSSTAFMAPRTPGQHRVGGDEGRVDACLDVPVLAAPVRSGPPGHREQLEGVAELLRPGEVLGDEPHDPLGQHVLWREPGAEGELREQAELLRGVAPDTSSVGSASAYPSRCASASAVASGSPFSAIEVRMKLVVPFTIPWMAWMRSDASASRSVRMTGHAAGHGALVVHVDALLLGQPEDLVPVEGEQRLVGGDHVLAGLGAPRGRAFAPRWCRPPARPRPGPTGPRPGPGSGW